MATTSLGQPLCNAPLPRICKSILPIMAANPKPFELFIQAVFRYSGRVRAEVAPGHQPHDPNGHWFTPKRCGLLLRTPKPDIDRSFGRTLRSSEVDLQEFQVLPKTSEALKVTSRVVPSPGMTTCSHFKLLIYLRKLSNRRNRPMYAFERQAMTCRYSEQNLNHYTPLIQVKDIEAFRNLASHSAPLF